MRVPVSWLREYVNFDMPVDELGELLSMTGTKLETITYRGVPEGLDLYRVGRVLTREQHPNADRLSLCMVDVGDGEPRQIVCGATNFEAGATVAVVLPGATLPDGTVLRKAKLRGVESDGMILSERELDLSNEHEGIMVLSNGAAPGTPLSEVLPIADAVMEFEITSNRPDCLAVYGIAREVSAALDTDLAPWPGKDPEATGEGSIEDYVKARVDDPDRCPRWAGRVFTDVRIGPSPPWLKARIAAAGMRPISNVVDITNYVMLCLGEPTHAFDLDKVSGREIIVRRPADGEKVVTLDGQERTLDSDMLVIADAEKPSAIAGLMGSEWSEVSDETTTVLLECANFDGPNVQATSTKLGLRTEGSTRWEKGVDPYLVPRALALASQLMVEVAGARMVPGTVDVHGPLPDPPVAPLRPERLERVIGMSYPPDRVAAILTRLGFEPAGDRWRVPTWRAGDVTREVDLIEEVSRIDGLWKVPTLMPPHADAVGRLVKDVRLRRKVVDVLLGAGLTEAATVTFTDEELPDRLRLASADPRRNAVRVANPMSADQSLLRMLIFPGLLTSASRNLDAGRDRVALFETGRVFLSGSGPLPDQPVRVGGILAGRDAGFFEIKGVAELLARSLHIDLPVTDAAEPFFHPGRSARLGDSGLLGELHPLVAERFGIEQPVSLFEIDLEELQRRMPAVIVYRDLISFPPVRQDIAVILSAEVSAARLVEVIREAGGALLTSAEVFDVYEGPQVGDGRRSLAVHLIFQSPERTLTDEDADAVRERIVAAVGERLGGELRS
ncbi:MAG: phenylalanyl-tRNA synthetase beta chain [Gaiellales bacterium]|jgi:phenylalanyl-tRNA synthetase beta chain|nr:phenylalanyl-tRNA synthetase beta chain [Gaiellales bacterium]